MNIYDFTPEPHYVGCWEIGGPMGLRVSMEKRPSRWQIFWNEYLIGWKWVDFDDEG